MSLRKLFLCFTFILLTIASLFQLSQAVLAGAPPVAEYYRDPLISIDVYSPFYDGEVLSTYESSGVFLPAYSETDGSPRDNLTAGGTFSNPDVGMFMINNGLDHFLGYGIEKSSTSFGYDLQVQVRGNVNDAPTWTSPVLSSSGNCGGACPYGFSQIQNMLPDYQDEGLFVLFEEGAEGGPIPIPGGSTELVHLNDNTGAIDWQVSFGWQSVSMIPDYSDGVYILRDSGPEFDGSGSTSVGILEHYTPAGKDMTFGVTGSVVVSSDSVSQKGGATLVPYLDSGFNADDIFVIWADADSINPGIYARRFDENGTAHASFLSSRGKQVVSVPAMDVGYFQDYPGLFQIHAESNPVIAEDIVVGAAIIGGEVSVFSFDGDGVNSFPCQYNQVSSDFDQFDVVIQYGNSGGDKGVYLIWQDGNDLNMSLVNENGQSYWSVGGETIVSSPTLEVTLKTPGFDTSARGRYEGTSALMDISTNGGTVVYGTGGVGFTQYDFDESNFAASGGGDCSAGSVPDAIADLGAVAGDTEVDLSWSAPAANGSAITDYVIESRVTPAGVFSVVADGVSVATSYTVTGLTNGLTYEFRVSAVNGIGTGAVSNLVQATPAGLSGRSIARGKGQAPSVILGKIRAFFSASQPSEELRGSAPQGFSEDLQEPDGGEDRSAFIRYEQEQQALRGSAQQRKQSAQLRDLILELTRLFLWMKGSGYQPTLQTVERAQPYYDFFLTRYFHRLAGVEYLESRQDVGYEFTYRDPINDPTRILADYQKSVMLTFGRVCFSEDLLAYAEEIDVPGYGAWFHRYAETMKGWTAEVLGTSRFMPWRTTRDIDVLQSLLRFLVNHCEG